MSFLTLHLWRPSGYALEPLKHPDSFHALSCGKHYWIVEALMHPIALELRLQAGHIVVARQVPNAACICDFSVEIEVLELRLGKDLRPADSVTI